MASPDSDGDADVATDDALPPNFEDLTTSTDGFFSSASTALDDDDDDDDDEDDDDAIISTSSRACGSSARYDRRNDS